MAVGFLESLFEVGAQGGRFGFGWDIIEGQADGAASQGGSEFIEFDQAVQGNPVRVFADFACGHLCGLQNFFVEGPFLEAELFGAFFPVQSLLLKQLIQRAAAGVGAVVVEGGGA